MGFPEVYLFGDEWRRGAVFNLDKAKLIVADGRRPVLVPEPQVMRFLARGDWCQMHLNHVNPERPGIAMSTSDGSLLLDGIHRAVRCVHERRTFYAYMLKQWEPRPCFLPKEDALVEAYSIIETLLRLLAIAAIAPPSEPVMIQVECTPSVLARVNAMLTPQERRRFVMYTRRQKTGVQAWVDSF